MAKVADVKVSWKRSPDDKVSTQVLHLDNNGVKSDVVLTPDVESFEIVVGATGWGYSAQALVK